MIRSVVRVGLAMLLFTCLTSGFVGTSPVGAAQQPTALVFGTNDNGEEGDNVAESLRRFGVDVTRQATLPAKLNPNRPIWHISAYSGLTTSDADRLADFVKQGGSLYLTGERPCCEELNGSVQRILRATLKDQKITVGGMGDVNGPFTFNTDVTDHVARFPNLLLDFLPRSPGGMSGLGNVRGRNVFASNGSTVVGGIWSEKDVKTGRGRIALLMDVDWLDDDDRDPTIENIQAFLSKGKTCSNSGAHAGMLWTGPSRTESPGNCSVVITPSKITWTVGSDAGKVTLKAASTGLTSKCSSSVVRGATKLTCNLTDADPRRGNLRVTATDRLGTSVRSYTVRPKNNPVNLPPGQAKSSNWWTWPDRDQDGIPDHWENNGVWVGDKFLNLPGLGANPRHKDLFLHYDWQEGHPVSNGMTDYMRDTFANAPLSNPDGQKGIKLHVSTGSVGVPKSQIGQIAKLNNASLQRVMTYSGFAASPKLGGGGVPQIFKWMINIAHNPTRDGTIGMARIQGLVGWTGYEPSLADAFIGSVSTRLPADAVAFSQASNAVHELGHTLGLHHHGSRPCIDGSVTKSDSPKCLANSKAYKSVMSYAYSQFGVPGLLRPLIDYSRETKVNLDWKLGKRLGQLTLVSGQWGEWPNMYYAQNKSPISTKGQLPDEPSGREGTQDADHRAMDQFFKWAGIKAKIKRPRLRNRRVTVRAGRQSKIRLHATNPNRQRIRFVIDHWPSRGRVRTTRQGLIYNVPKKARGRAVIVVRAVDRHFGSKPARVFITIKP